MRPPPEPDAVEFGSIRERSTRSLTTALFGRGATRFIFLVQSLILARLLTPEDFGVFAVALLALSSVETVSETGVVSAVVQREDINRRYLDTAFTIQVVRATILFLLVWIVAEPVSVFFREPNAASVLRALAAGIVIQALANVGLAVHERNITFGPLVRLDILAGITGTAIAVGAAFSGFGVWSFVAGYLAQCVSRTLLSYLLHAYRPRVSFHRREATALLAYSRWLFLQGVLIYASLNIDDAVVGRTIGIAAVGLYSQAYRISQTPTTELSQVLGRVALPSFARAHQMKRPVDRPFLSLLHGTSLLSIPTGVAVVLLAPSFVDIVLGNRWLPMVPAVQILGGYSIIRSVTSISGPVLNALGHARKVATLLAIRLIIVVGLVLPLTESQGIVGTAWALLAAFAAIGVPWVVLTCREVAVTVRQYLTALVPAMAVGAALTVILLIVLQVFRSQPLTALVTGTLAFGTVMIATAHHQGWTRRMPTTRYIT